MTQLRSPAVARANGPATAQAGGKSGSHALAATPVGTPLLQAKLTISEPGDLYEQEADRVADQVMRMPDPAFARPGIDPTPIRARPLQRRCTDCEDEELQRKSPNPQAETSSFGLDTVAATLRQGGRPLDPATRGFFEPRFGRDFGDVRIHTNTQAAASARAVNALAYTVGRDVVFNSGQYAPHDDSGKRLLAHELTHVVQQSGATEQVQRQGTGDGGTRDGGTRDGGTRDGGTRDGGTRDGGASDAGTSDAATSDGGTSGVTRVFSLTFDDGPHAAALGKGVNRTEQVLDTLKAKGIKGGFFIQTGVSHRGANPVGRTLVKRMQSEGHRVGIHTGGSADHEPHPSAEAAGRLTPELTAAKNYIKTETGVTPDLVRPPFGTSSTAVDAAYAALSLTNLLWDIDGDLGSPSLAGLKARLESSNAKDPGIPAVHARGWKGTTPSHPKIVILYHDIRADTAANVGLLIDHIRSVTSTVTGGRDTADFAPP